MPADTVGWCLTNVMYAYSEPRPQCGALFLGSFSCAWKVTMEKFVHQQNLLVLRKQLATTPNEAQRLQLSRLLAEEEEKDQMPPK